MLDTNVRQALAARLKVVLVLYLALLGSLGVYVVMGAVVIDGAELAAPDPGMIEPLSLILGVVAVVAVVASYFVRARMLRTGLAALPGQIDLSQVDALTRATFTPWVLAWALCDAAAVFGLVLFVLTHRWELFLPFVGLAAMGMILHAPSLRAIEEALERR
jgi:hypothetical protein